MSRKLLLAAYCIVCFAAFRSPAAEYVISAGDITSLTNLIGQMGNNIRLEPGIYDLRPLTNAPMYTSEYYGRSLLNLGKWTKLSGISPNAADTVLIGASPFRILHGTGESECGTFKDIGDKTAAHAARRSDDYCTNHIFTSYIYVVITNR